MSAGVSSNAHALLTVDGVGWHHVGDKRRVRQNITLLSLTPYSPELNPAENM